MDSSKIDALARDLAVDGIRLTRSGPEGMTMTVSAPMEKLGEIRAACDKMARIVAEDELLEAPEGDLVIVPEGGAGASEPPAGDSQPSQGSEPPEPPTGGGNSGSTGNPVTI